MHFLPRRRPLELDAQRVRVLRPALNTPVVATSELPVGPACGAIVVFVEPGAGVQISVGVRSLACGSVAIYSFDGPLSGSVVGVAIDAALSFAESMGFLFDDDIAGNDAGSREKAVARWQEMIGDGMPSTAPPPSRESGALFEPDAGELTDPPAEEEMSSGSGSDRSSFDLPDAPPAPLDVELRAAGATEIPLTKFRSAPETDSTATSGSGSSTPTKRALGRMRLVKRAPGEPVQDGRRAWLLRLLTSF